jgi:hypothetical protein
MVLKSNSKILLPLIGVSLVIVSILVFNNVLAGIGIGLAGALIFGPDVTEKRGKTAGIVYSKNRSGPFTRSRIKPKNPQTNAQQANREIHKRLMQAWKRTEVDHKAFIQYAEDHLVSNRMGQKIRLSGINWFVKINRNALKANLESPLILTPPVHNVRFPSVENLKVTANADTQSVRLEMKKDGEFTEDMKIQVFATRQLSTGVFSPYGFVEIGVYEPSETIDISANYIARWDRLIADRKIFVRIRMVSEKGDSGGRAGGNGKVV